MRAASVAGVVVLGLVATSAVVDRPAAAAEARPVASSVRSVDFASTQAQPRLAPGQDSSEEAAAPAVVVSPALDARGASVADVTWDPATPAAPAQVEVRTRVGGTWSDWSVVGFDPDHGPDGAEAAGARAGTDPVALAPADEVQARVTAGADGVPQALRLSVVDPGRSAADAAPAAEAASASTAGSAAAVAPPPILSRAAWGADESLRGCCITYGQIKAGFVHHTVNSNAYAPGDVAGIIRGIYRLHLDRGWQDIGYNFLVDRFGRVWEGRAGGVDKPVIGAHTAGYNGSSFAMSSIGNHELVAPPAEVIEAYARVYAWKLGLHGVAPLGTTTINGTRFQVISGHRDAGSTACPGQYLYDRLPQIRSLVAAKMGSIRFGGLRRDATSDGWPDLALRRGDGAAFVPSAAAEFLGRTPAGTGWDTVDSLTSGGDLDGDGTVDLLAKDGRGTLWLYRGDGRGGWVDRRPIDSGWGGLDLLISVGDLDRDGARDLVARDPGSGVLWRYRGDGRGNLVQGRAVLGTGWETLDVVAAVGDVDGDGAPDLVGRERTALGTLWLYRGDGRGGLLATRTAIGTGWGTLDAVLGPGDWDGDGRVDLMGRDRATGALLLYAGAGGGSFPTRRFAGSGWNTVGTVLAAGDADRDGVPDVYARGADGVLWLYRGDGRTTLGAPRVLGGTGDRPTLLPGDWDGDARADLLTVSSTGGLELRRGDGAGGFAAPRVVNGGWDTLRVIASVGDFDGDGRSDLVGLDRGNRGWLYRGDGTGGVLERVSLGAGWEQIDLVVGVGHWDTADGAPDLLARVRATGELRVYPGNGPGGVLPPSTVGTGWEIMESVVGAGDFDGDGGEDLLALERATGRVWLYPTDGRGRWLPWRPIAGSFGVRALG